METFAVLRACQRFDVPMMGLRGVSDGPGELDGVNEWTELLPLLDERLAAAVNRLPGHGFARRAVTDGLISNAP